jgi:tyrosinase
MALTRRSFVVGAASIPFAVWLEQNAAWAAGPFIRSEARTAAGQAMLKSYAAAVKKMMNHAQTPEGDPRSWTFQWYTHFVKGSTNKNAELARIYPVANAWKALATEMWNTCQAHNGVVGASEPFFLPWHRMFVFFFEAIVRQASGNPNFALPYWNYSIAGATHGVIPPEFTKQNDPTFGSLYIGKRNPGVNTGTPIDQGQPDSPLDPGPALAECQYLPNGAKQGFNLKLDSTVHGQVHVLTGNGQNMGTIPWAAGDPVFWMHHCNIDRLWASWNAGGRKNPGGSFLTKQFVFADTAGKKVVGTIGNFLDIAKLNYSYDRLERVPACPPSLLNAAAAAPLKIAAKPGIPLGPGPVSLTLTSAGGAAASVPLGTRIDKLPPNHHLYIVVRDVASNVQPEVLYHLYLQTRDARNYIGAIHFFDSSHAHGEGGAVAKFFSFDITELAKRLRKEGKLGANAEVTIAPAGAPAAAAKPVIGEVSLVEQAE